MITLLVSLALASSGAERGKAVYQDNCIACHNTDPHRDGAVGPAVFGSSKALVEARVLRASYPPGYKPKRDTHVMPDFPWLKNDVDVLYRFLNEK